MWRELPKGSALDRYNPATHVGPFRPEDEDASAMHLRADYRWQQRQFGTEQLMIDLVFNSTLCGIYCTLPYGDRPRVPDFFTHV